MQLFVCDVVAASIFTAEFFLIQTSYFTYSNISSERENDTAILPLNI